MRLDRQRKKERRGKQKVVASAPRTVRLRVPAILLEDDVPATPPLSGPGQKYVSPPATVHEHFAGPGLPEAYGTGRIFLAARDPRLLYAFWDLTAAQLRAYNRKAMDGHLTLRIYKDRIAGQPESEVAMAPDARNAFLPVTEGGVHYLAELGYYDEAQQWTSICASEPTDTPREALAEDTTSAFQTVPPFDQQEQPALGVHEFVQPPPPIQKVEEVLPVIAQLVSANEIRVAHAPEPQGPAWPESGPLAPPPVETLSGPQEAPHATGSAESAFDVSGLRGENMLLEFLDTRREAEVREEEIAAKEVWTPAHEQALAELIQADAARGGWTSSVEIVQLIRGQLEKAGLPGGPGVAWSGALAPGEGVTQPAEAAISSPAPHPPAGKGFWFNINAELVIYGATEPHASVKLGGRLIKLRPDGTFSYRFALPDGNYDLPVMATSVGADDSRAAVLSFSRRTEFKGKVAAHPQDPALKPPVPEHIY